VADNTTLNPGASGDTIRTIQRPGGVKSEVVQLDFGGDISPNLSPESLVTQANPLPVDTQEVLVVLKLILAELRAHNLHLASISGQSFDTSLFMETDLSME